MIEIKHKITKRVLLKVDANNLSGADLIWANLSDADLTNADLNDVKGTFIFNFGVKLKIIGYEE